MFSDAVSDTDRHNRYNNHHKKIECVIEVHHGSKFLPLKNET